MKKFRPALILASLAMVLLGARVSPLAGEEFPGQTVTGTGTDIIIVLDNSGSMKANDPKNLTREVVRNFINRLGQDDANRMGMVIFDAKANLAPPLTQLTKPADRKLLLKSLRNVNYRGRWTNIPAAMERAIYELKTMGRKDAVKIIVFLTDGIVDTGNKADDTEKLKWLKNELAQDSKQAGIRIFGIAFTDNADFSLIQSLAIKTDGQYYRAYKAEDIQGVFQRIENSVQAIKQKQITNVPKNNAMPKQIETAPGPATSPGQPQPGTGEPPVKPGKTTGSEPAKLFLPLPLLIGIGLLLLVIIIFLLTRRKSEPAVSSPEGTAGAGIKIPEAKLIDQQAEFYTQPVLIKKPYITIGRASENDIKLPRETVSAFHATIKYEENRFYLEDQRSSNFTKLNGKKILPNKPVNLKSGDLITIDIYEFQFVLPHIEAAGRTVIQKSSFDDGSKTIMRDPPVIEPTGSVFSDRDIGNIFDDNSDEVALETQSYDDEEEKPGENPPSREAPPEEKTPVNQEPAEEAGRFPEQPQDIKVINLLADRPAELMSETINEQWGESFEFPPSPTPHQAFDKTIVDMELLSDYKKSPPETGTLIEVSPSESTRYESLDDAPGSVTDYCPNHPSRKATDLCLRCKKGYCSQCISEVDGRYLCPECAGQTKK